MSDGPLNPAMCHMSQAHNTSRTAMRLNTYSHSPCGRCVYEHVCACGTLVWAQKEKKKHPEVHLSGAMGGGVEVTEWRLLG